MFILELCSEDQILILSQSTWWLLYKLLGSLMDIGQEERECFAERCWQHYLCMSWAASKKGKFCTKKRLAAALQRTINNGILGEGLILNAQRIEFVLQIRLPFFHSVSIVIAIWGVRVFFCGFLTLDAGSYHAIWICFSLFDYLCLFYSIVTPAKRLLDNSCKIAEKEGGALSRQCSVCLLEKRSWRST